MPAAASVSSSHAASASASSIGAEGTLRPTSPMVSMPTHARPASRFTYGVWASEVAPIPWRNTSGVPSPGHRYTRVGPYAVTTSTAWGGTGHCSAQSASSIARKRASASSARHPPDLRLSSHWYICTIKPMPKRADRDERVRQITDAVCRITIKGGLQAATFREVAAEAGVSVRLVQYYFGTKDQLLLATQRRVAERSVERIQRLRVGGSDEPVEVLRTIMRSFIPVDDESRDAMLVFVALFTASLLDPVLKRPEAAAPPASMRSVFAEQLRRGRRRAGVDPDKEALVLLVMVAGLSEGVLDGQITADEAFAVIDYSLGRALR